MKAKYRVALAIVGGFALPPSCVEVVGRHPRQRHAPPPSD
jgi:hypothetical protein